MAVKPFEKKNILYDVIYFFIVNYTFLKYFLSEVLGFERSEECIEFYLMYFFLTTFKVENWPNCDKLSGYLQWSSKGVQVTKMHTVIFNFINYFSF